MKRVLFFTVSGFLALTVFAQPLLPPGAPVPVAPPRKLEGLKPVPTRRPSTQPFPTSTFTADSKTDQLQLIRGNGMLGQFLGFDPQYGLSWSHPDIKPDKLTIPADRISRIDFAVKPVPANAKSHSGVIEFSNGDRLTGEVLGMENNKLRISTWYAGESGLR